MCAWIGDTHCQVCHKRTEDDPYFYDAKTILQGRWATLCQTCFDNIGIGLGTGLGQKYDSKTKEKVEG